VLTKDRCRPRFLVLQHGAHHGARDEIVGWSSYILGTANTLAFAERIAARDGYHDCDAYVTIQDTWDPLDIPPAEPWHVGPDDPDELPF
jgi:hypothetical protein